MRRNSNPGPAARNHGPARVLRIVLGVLVGLNLIAAGLVMFPPGGSAEGLEQELGRLQKQVQDGKTRLEMSRAQVASIETARGESEQFLNAYFADRRTVYSSILDELGAVARRAGLRPRGTTYPSDLIDGSDVLGMMTITATYEGSYLNLVRFAREIDRSSSLLIIESLTAAPQQGSADALIQVKLNAFTRDTGAAGIPVASVQPEAEQ
jgi:hypothetical protein